MNQAFSRLLKIALSTLGCLCATGKISLAQVTPDNTVNTQVNQSGNISEITGGETRGSNLFHSFENFSVPTNNEAFFNNAESIGNIFSRVTGGNVSSIDGAIRANGAANLFLINPAGIIFGENASLNIGGSFYGSTAGSILFPDGEYSALQPESESVLTVEVPIGLGFASNPGEITNSSVVNDGRGLEVAPGNNITLVGGNVKFEGGSIFAPDGTVNLGGLSTAGIVNLNDNGSLSFPENIARADTIFSNGAGATVAGERGGNINLYARNAELIAGDGGTSGLVAGIIGDSTPIDVQPGNITIDATEEVTIDNSFVANVVAPEASGSAGNVTINTGSLSLTNGGIIDTGVIGQGNAGSIEITANDTISIDGESLDGFPSTIISQIAPGAVGDAESSEISINTNSLSLTNGGQVSTVLGGQGNAGSIEITADDTISIDGESSDGSPSGISSGVAAEASGNAGSLTIDTGSLSLTDGGQVGSNTLGNGNAELVEITAKDTISIDGQRSDGTPSQIASTVQPGAVGDAKSVNITTNFLSLTSGGIVNTNTFGQGNAGSIEIMANDTISIDGEGSDGSPSGIGSGVQPGAVGDAKDISITTNSLSLSNGGQIGAGTFGQGNAGAIEIMADDTISVDGERSDGFASFIGSTVELGAVGNANDIDITTNSLSLSNGGQIGASTFGQGNAGAIEITANNTVSIDGERSNGFSSLIDSTVQPGAEGDAEDISITTNFLSLTNGGEVSTNTSGRGNAGSIEIMANDTISIDGESLDASPSFISSGVAAEASGNAGSVTINTSSLSLTNGGEVSSNTLGSGNAGLVEITAKDTISIDGERSDGISSLIGSTVQPGAEGDAEDISITANSLSVTNGGQVNASTFSQGNAGSIEIMANDAISIDGGSDSSPSGIFSTLAPGAVGDAEDISITTNSLSLTNGGRVSTSTFGQGNAGAIKIMANDIIFIDGGANDFPSGIGSTVEPGVAGNANDISITTKSLSIVNGGQVIASTFGQGNAGTVEINASDTISIDGGANDFSSGIFSTVEPVAEGNAEDIRITTNSLFLAGGSQVIASTFGQGNAGTVEINASDSISVSGKGLRPRNFSAIGSTVGQEATGDAGGIMINANSLSLAEQGLVSTSTFGQGDAGQMAIKANSLNLDSGLIEATTNSGGGNIDLRVAEDLTLKNNSLISAEAVGDADGGNLSIDAKFIVASPNQNNDLIARAEQGTGGNINIVSSGVFGLQERSSTPINSTNDIDASSELGVDGTVNLNTNNDFLNSFELIIPDFAVAKQALQGSCFARRNSQQGSFVYGGTGGLPVSPDSMIEEEESTSSRLSRVEPGLPQPNPLETKPDYMYPEDYEWQPGDPIIEPTDLVKTKDGRLLWVNRHVSKDDLVCR